MDGRARAQRGNSHGLTCNDPLGCRGRITLRPVGGGNVLARGRVRVASMRRRVLQQISLTPAGRRLVRARKRNQVVARINLQGASVRRVRRRITLVRG